MNLPPDFISIITNTFGEDGEALIANLPALIDEASQRWGLTNVQPVSNLSYNFVAFARRGEVISPNDKITPQTTGRGRFAAAPTMDLVLKIGVPRDELTSEIAALRLFNGDGACQLLDADEEKGFLLLERLHPGVMLSTLEDDEEATYIAAEVMQKIWCDVPVESGSSLPSVQQQAVGLQSQFIKLSDWFDGLKKIRPMFNGGMGPFNEKIVARVERSVKDFFAENHMPVLMHGDFHHFNILLSERGWLVIDPKGVIGPAGYEVGPFMINPWGSFSDGVNFRLRVKRRIDILHEHLGWERERILEWSLAHAVISAWWSIEDNTGGEYAIQFAEMLADL
jgi:streptomycin 6-kinase